MIRLARKIEGLKENLDLVRSRREARDGGRPVMGYIGGQGDANLGDEAMLEAARRLYAGSTLVPIAYPRQEERLAKLRYSGKGYFQSVILGGGTLINEYVWGKQVRKALDQGLPVSTLGTGVGSCGFGHPEQANLREWKAMLADFRAIGVRGPLSMQALESIGVQNVHVVGDLALSLCVDTLPPLPVEKRLALNITKPPERTGESNDYSALEELKPVLCRYLQEGWEIVPVAMHRDDVAPMQQCMYELKREAVNVAVLRTAAEFFDIVSTCRFTVAVRLHAAVLSCCTGVPPLMLGYRDKCLDFMQSMDLADWYVSLSSPGPEEITAKVRALELEASGIRESVWSRARGYQAALRDYVEVTQCRKR